jgi:hypothetical protein
MALHLKPELRGEQIDPKYMIKMQVSIQQMFYLKVIVDQITE